MIHAPDCTCETLGCKLRREGVFALSSAATPTRVGRRPWRDPAKHCHNSWEAGTAGEHRADGSFMPYLGENGRRIHVKEWHESSGLRKVRREQLTAPSIKET